jgi:DNA-directed RNA polymerase alpha subunit
MDKKDKSSEESFLLLLAAPARRALENNGIKTIEALSRVTEKEILQFHGIGKSAIPVLKAELKKRGLSFKK